MELSEHLPVPTSGDTLHGNTANGKIVPVSTRDRVHRHELREYALRDAQPFHRAALTRLYHQWERWNAAYYANRLLVPYLTLTEPSAPNIYGQCCSVSSWGGGTEIRLRPSLLHGSHPHVLPGAPFDEGRFLFVEDILLHEMVHQFHQEISGVREDSYHGHGPAFRDVGNRIGKELGLPPVRSAKKRGAEQDLPSCAQWPHCVRPPAYYQGAYVVPTSRDTTQAPQDNIAVAVAEIRDIQAAIAQLAVSPEAARHRAALDTLWERLAGACVLLGARDEAEAHEE